MIISASERANSVQEYFFSQKLKQIRSLVVAGHKIINLGIGNPDLPPPSEAVYRLVNEASKPNTHGYQSYTGVPELRQAFADWYSRFYGCEFNADNEILPLMGSKEGIMHISLAFLNQGDTVLIPDPGYPTYTSVSRIAGAKLLPYNLKKENGWMPDFSEIEQNDLSGVKLMWINYPNMPTGAPADHQFFEEIISFAYRHKILIINDNPYDFVLNTDYRSIFMYPGAKDVSLELNSLSKSHNMAGWRVGAVFGRADYIATILKIKSNMDSGMFLPVQLAAATALVSTTDTWHETNNQIYLERRTIAWQILDALQCDYDKHAQGLFVWAEIPGHYQSGFELSDLLLDKAEVFITPGGIFGENGLRYIRISLCATEEQLTEALERIKKMTQAL